LRTNIEIDDQLIAKAMKALNVSTKKEAVNVALQQVILKDAQRDVLQLRGQIEWRVNLEDMRTNR
jgi:Arc/MetJ family transcription regulator